MTIEDVRRIALALPEATEQDHHGMPSFRVRNRIFATVPDDEHVRVMAEEHQIRAAVQQDPSACREFYWGKRLACVVVTTALACRDQVEGLLQDAYLRKAPKALLDQLEDRGGDG
ncbi:MAG: MmcQ/YjbR family DNA-binding protein [Solirubrobacteraceae bacterium]